MTLPASITLAAYAKLNLALSVGPPVPPKGFHPIASWFVPIGLRDDLAIERNEPDVPSRFTIQWASDALRPTPFDWPLSSDLVVRAAKLLERHVGRTLPLTLALRKRIPVGGGLGGGSSDGAAALVGIDRLFGLGLGAPTLRTLSTELGSDMAFFIDEASREGEQGPRAALVTGFGDQLERTMAPAANVLLFFPAFGCPTGAVYGAFDRRPAARLDAERVRAIVESARRSGSIDAASLFNDLAAPACDVEPRLAAAMEELGRAVGVDGAVHLTGSGSTMFAIVDPAEVEAVAARCRAARPDIAMLPTRILPSP